MRVTRRMAWITFFLFCLIIWGLIATGVTYAASSFTGKPRIEPVEKPKVVDIEKIKKLDLNDKQKRFIDSLTEQPQKKSD